MKVGFINGRNKILSSDVDDPGFMPAIPHQQIHRFARMNNSPLSNHINVVNLVFKYSDRLFDDESAIEDVRYCIGDHFDALFKLSKMIRRTSGNMIGAHVDEENIYMAKWAGGDEVPHNLNEVVGRIIQRWNGEQNEKLINFINEIKDLKSWNR